MNRHAPIDFIPSASAGVRLTAPVGRPRHLRPRCSRVGCANAVRKPAHKYCSVECRGTALAPIYAARRLEHALHLSEPDTRQSSPGLREAFRLQFARVPVAEWSAVVRDEYNEYIRFRRRMRRRRLNDDAPEPQRSPALNEVFQNLARHIRAADWSDEAKAAYSEYQKERRAIRNARLAQAEEEPERMVG